MDKTALLNRRKQEIVSMSEGIRGFLESFLDEYSFVEMDTFSFSKGEAFDEAGSFGEGVITGYATIDGIPVCLFAQNYEVCKGGMSKAQADKIIKIQKQAQKTGAVMISVIDTAGAKLGEGITALEGYAGIMAQADSMRGEVTQIAIIKGSCLGAMSYFAALNDFVIMMDESVASTSSPAIIAASSGIESAKDICNAKFHYTETGFASLIAKDAGELSQLLRTLLNLLSGEEEFDSDTDFNRQIEQLNGVYDAGAVIENLFDSPMLELSAGFAPEIRCGLAKLGGITVGAIICGSDPKGVNLTGKSAGKTQSFVKLLSRYNIPLITFVNCAGVKSDLDTEKSSIIAGISDLISAINGYDGAKISVICGRAIGIGFTALASKSLGFDNCVAWADAVVSPLGEAASAVLHYSGEIRNAQDPAKAREEVERRYASIEADPFNAAKCGSIDDIIMPSATRQYLISMLMMLI